MEKFYETPEIEIVEINVEKGYASNLTRESIEY